MQYLAKTEERKTIQLFQHNIFMKIGQHSINIQHNKAEQSNT